MGETILLKDKQQSNLETKKMEVMRTIESVKLPLIDRIMKTNNEELLMAIDTIFKSTHTEDVQSLNSYQIEMLMMSENDIKQGNLISEVDFKKADAEWMALLCPRIN